MGKNTKKYLHTLSWNIAEKVVKTYLINQSTDFVNDKVWISIICACFVLIVTCNSFWIVICWWILFKGQTTTIKELTIIFPPYDDDLCTDIVEISNKTIWYVLVINNTSNNTSLAPPGPMAAGCGLTCTCMRLVNKYLYIHVPDSQPHLCGQWLHLQKLGQSLMS